MVDRQSTANDLNAIANAMTRDESLVGILEELDIVTENINQLIAEENADNVEKEIKSEDPSETEEGCTCAG